MINKKTIPSILYILFFLIFGIYYIFQTLFNTGDSEFSLLPNIILTLPWSVIFLSTPTWYDMYASKPILYSIFATLNLLPYTIVNLFIIYFISKTTFKKQGIPMVVYFLNDLIMNRATIDTNNQNKKVNGGLFIIESRIAVLSQPPFDIILLNVIK